MLWDCKREALRGLGVNTGQGNTTRHDYQSLYGKFLSFLQHSRARVGQEYHP